MRLKLLILFTALCIPISANAYWQQCYNTAVDGAVTNYTEDANCMGAWLMSGAVNGSETDVSGEDGTLTNSGTVGSTQTVPGGFSGTARTFQSADSGDNLQHADSNSTDIYGAEQALSFGAWVYFNTCVTDKNIIGKYEDSAGEYQYALKYDASNDSIHCTIHDGTSGEVAIGATDLTTSTWYHVTCVHDPTLNQIIVYVDGSVDSNGGDNPLSHTTGITNSTAKFMIGGRTGYDRWLDGYVDEAFVFDRVLSQSEISDIVTDGIDGTKGGTDSCVTPSDGNTLNEGFVDTGYENTWNETGSPDEDYTLSGSPPADSCTEGLQTNVDEYTYWDNGSSVALDTNDVDITAEIYFDNITISGTNEAGAILLWDDDTNPNDDAEWAGRFRIEEDSGGFRIFAEGSVDSSKVNLSLDTWYTLKMHLDGLTPADSYFTIDEGTACDQPDDCKFTRQDVNPGRYMFLGESSGFEVADDTIDIEYGRVYMDITAASVACTGSETMGYTTVGTAASSLGSLSTYGVGVYTVPCTGYLDLGYMYSTGAFNTGKVSVYLDDGDGTPDDEEDTLIAQSNSMISASAVWASGEFPGVAVTKDDVVWLVAEASYTGWDGKRDTPNGTLFSDYSADCPSFNEVADPVNAGSCNYVTDDLYEMSLYVTFTDTPRNNTTVIEGTEDSTYYITK